MTGIGGVDKDLELSLLLLEAGNKDLDLLEVLEVEGFDLEDWTGIGRGFEAS